MRPPGSLRFVLGYLSMLCKSEAICLRVTPFSHTSHMVQWLTREGCLMTVVKGAVRPKSFFLGQYDLFYRCEIVYFRRKQGAAYLRECTPLDYRDHIRGNWRATLLAQYACDIIERLAPPGQPSGELFNYCEHVLNALPPRLEIEDHLLQMSGFSSLQELYEEEQL